MYMAPPCVHCTIDRCQCVALRRLAPTRPASNHDLPPGELRAPGARTASMATVRTQPIRTGASTTGMDRTAPMPCAAPFRATQHGRTAARIARRGGRCGEGPRATGRILTPCDRRAVPSAPSAATGRRRHHPAAHRGGRYMRTCSSGSSGSSSNTRSVALRRLAPTRPASNHGLPPGDSEHPVRARRRWPPCARNQSRRAHPQREWTGRPRCRALRHSAPRNTAALPRA